MGCCGSRKKLPGVRTEQKWEYINLDDFHSTSCWTPLSYGILYISLIISIAVYAVDTFTAVNLLAFARWSGQIEPVLPLEYSRWIFSGCIVFSFVLLFFRWVRAVRVIKQSGVAQSYLDPLAVRVQSVRVGKEGRGWKRFLVFAELTKGKKGASYVALFTYFSFEAWLRILLAEGPRQIINALTLYSVMQLDLLPTGENAAEEGKSPVGQFFVNVGLLAEKQGQQAAIILFSMLFTLVIWVVTFLNLMVAVVLYLIFLLHHIPSSDGSLSAYCRRKMNESMDSIVRKKVDKAMKKENARRAKTPCQRPTLPDVDGMVSSTPPMLSRQTTQTSMSQYTTRSGMAPGSGLTSPTHLERQPTMASLNGFDYRPRPLARTETQDSSASWRSYGSGAPLIGAAGGMGSASPGAVESPGVMSRAGSYSSQPHLNRTYTNLSQSTQRSYAPGMGPNGRSMLGQYQTGPNSRSASAMGEGATPGYHASPVEPYGSQNPAEQDNPYFPPSSAYGGVRSPTGGSTRPYTPRGGPSTRSITPSTPYGRSYTPFRPES